ncbi:MAG: rod shape-determining protein MreC [Patescibacteria group bacterium]
MNFRQDKSKDSVGIKFLIFVLFAGVILYFSSSFVREKSYNVLSFVGTPFWAIGSGADGLKNDLFTAFSFKATLGKENERLQSENDSLKLLTLSTPVLQKENSELKKILGREDNGSSTASTIGGKSILANILSGPVVPPYGNLILDAGSLQGVAIGDKIIAGHNVILGDIIEVSKSSSRAVLYSSYGTETGVIINAETPLHATAVGYGGGNFYVEIQNSVIVKEGMIASLPGMERYILGIVEFVKNEESSASQKILLRYPINPSQIRFVRIHKSQ